MSTFNAAVRDTYDLAFQVSPIIFTGGEFAFPLPVIALVGQVASLAQGAATNGISIDDFYARYIPLPGGTVINNTIGTYPFANQQVAANAIIEQPKNISLMMISPVRDVGGYLSKMAIFTALQTAFQNHNRAGGTYTILTPAYIYTDCIMPGMTDITGGETKQQQVRWQLDFVKPLVSVSDANAAFSNQIGMISGGGKLTTSAPSGIAGVANSINNSLAGAV